MKTPERRGQLMLRTECGKCGKELPSPTRAVVHYRNCRVKTLVKSYRSANIPPAEYVPIVNHGPPDTMVCSLSCGDRGDQWWTTGCLCNCHYVGTTSRRMNKSGASVIGNIPGCEPEVIGSIPLPLTKPTKKPAGEAPAGSTKITERAGRVT